MSPTSSQNGFSRTFRASQGSDEESRKAARRSYPRLVNGIQGGWHVWASVRATGMTWRGVRLDFTLREPGGDLVSEPSRTEADLECCDAAGTDCDGFGETVGFPVLVDEPGLALGRLLTLTVVATDPEGRTASAERMIVPER